MRPQAWVGRGLALLVAGVALAVVPAAAASAHPLGSFTVNTADRLVVTGEGVELTHIVDLAELPTVQLSEGRAGVDTDDDGTLSAAELTTYAGRECARVADEVTLSVDGDEVALTVRSADGEPRPGLGGLATARISCGLFAEGRPRSSVSFDDPAARERNGWREVTAASQCGDLIDSNVPRASISNLLATYPEDLLSSPSDVSAAQFSVRSGGSCTSATDNGGVSTAADDVAPRGLDRFSETLTDLVKRPDLTVLFGLVSVLAAVAFGVLHALAPGHGKTVMAAYLVGQRGTKRQAVQLGAVVTFTHTASVLLLGLLVGAASLASPELVIPFTEILSGVLLAAVGVYLFVLARRRLRAAPDHDHTHHEHDHDDPHDDHPHGHDHPHDDHDHPRNVEHDHDVRPDEPRELVGVAGGTAVATRPLEHSHGGRTHTHAPLPDGPLSWKSLAAMGVAGGLVPSPSALIVLLSAVALGRAWFGVLLVVCYGLGMAITLTAAGLLLLRARAVLDRRGWTAGRRGARWWRLLPLGTAAIVIILGLVLVLRGILTGRGLL